MKKLLILTLTIITLFSCSSNENETTQDSIIGSWNLFSRNGTEVNDCAKTSIVIFSENGNYSNTGYFLENNGDCIQDFSEDGSGTNNDNNTFTIIINNESNIIPITFSNNNNTLTATFENGTTILVYNRN